MDVIWPVPSKTMGTKNNASITTVLTTILAFAFLLVFLVLKCRLTLFLSVFEKSELSSLENFGVSILFFFRDFCYFRTIYPII
jgi:maltodextrin utilization protein YvdJ